MPVTFEPNSIHTLVVPLTNQHTFALTVLLKAQVTPGGNIQEQMFDVNPGATKDFRVALTMPSATGTKQAMIEVQVKNVNLASSDPGNWSIQIPSTSVDTVTIAFAAPPTGVIGLGAIRWE